MKDKMNVFKRAKGVFVPNLAAKANVLAGFRCDFIGTDGKVEMLIAAHTFYRAYLNGELMGIGPAPAPFGRLKADRYELKSNKGKMNQLAIEVVGYVPEENNYSTHETSVLFAEVLSGDNVLTATGDGNWKCAVLPYRDFNMEPLSFGRRYPLEAYCLTENYTGWRVGQLSGECGCEVVEKAISESWKDGNGKELEPQGRIIQERRKVTSRTRQSEHVCAG